MTPSDPILRISCDELRLAVLEALDEARNYTRGHDVFAAAVVEAAKRRASIEVEFGPETAA